MRGSLNFDLKLVQKMTSSLLESLALGEQESAGILVKDSASSNGRRLLKALVCQALQRSSEVHVIQLDMDPLRWVEGFSEECTQRLRQHDEFSDPHGWSSDSGSSGLVGECSYARCVEVCGCEGVEGVTAVVLDSLSSLLLHHRTAVVCRLLHTLCQNCCLVIALLHADLHEDHVISQLDHVMPTSVHVTSSSERGPRLQRAETVHRKRSGKVLSLTELFSVGENFTSLSAQEAHSTGLSDVTALPSSDPAANLTFDLRLSSREKEARSHVVLPYTIQQTPGGEGGRGQIYYQPDEADDFDDSDPDDDLDV